MLGGIICWSCCWVCCCSRSIATASRGGTNELDFRGEVERIADREIWSCGGSVAGQVECWVVCSCSDVEVEARHGCLCHQERCRGWRGIRANEEWRILAITLGIWKERTLESKSQGGAERLEGKTRQLFVVHNRFVLV